VTRVGLIAKPDAPAAPRVIRQVVEWLATHGMTAVLEKETAGLLPSASVQGRSTS